VKGYILIDLSLDQIIIERSFKFKESVLHVPQQPHADTFFLPPVRDDDHAHADSSSDEISDSKDLYDPDTKLVQSNADSTHPYVDAELEKRPKWAKTSLQDVGDLVGDPTDTRRTRSNFKEPPLALTSIEPMPTKNILLVQYLDP
jgi:hypothetical protein